MNIISAVGSFKGTAQSIKINSIVKGFLESKGHTVHAIPVADGGDGLLQALLPSMKAEIKELETFNALGEGITAKVGIAGNTGIIEMALASGVAILKESELNPLEASTFGTGVLIRRLALSGAENILLGIGGSATNDGGFGCLTALGFDFYSSKGTPLTPKGENLEKIKSISDKNVPGYIKRLKIKIACDVTNPLLGEKGATFIYGKQKGADDLMLERLEKGMENYAHTVAEFCGKDYSALPGTGAAGGLGFGLMALLGAELEKGAEIVLEQAGYEEKLKTADLVITGEGKLDSQTANGKLPQIVAQKAKNHNVPCIALCGSCSANEESLSKMSISKIYQLRDYAPLEECMTKTETVILRALQEILKDLT